MQNLKGIRRARFWMTFSDNYLNHLKVLGNVRHDRHRARGIPGPAHRAHPVPRPGCCPIRPPWARCTKGKTCIGCVMRGVKDGKRKDGLYLQHLRPRSLLRRSGLPGHFLHHRRARHDRRHDDGHRPSGSSPACGIWNSSTPIPSWSSSTSAASLGSCRSSLEGEEDWGGRGSFLEKGFPLPSPNPTPLPPKTFVMVCIGPGGLSSGPY